MALQLLALALVLLIFLGGMGTMGYYLLRYMANWQRDTTKYLLGVVDGERERAIQTTKATIEAVVASTWPQPTAQPTTMGADEPQIQEPDHETPWYLRTDGEPGVDPTDTYMDWEGGVGVENRTASIRPGEDIIPRTGTATVLPDRDMGGEMWEEDLRSG